jgi:hypothetical protein
MNDRLPALLLAGCAGLAALIVVEWEFGKGEDPMFEPVPPQAKAEPQEVRRQEPVQEELLATAHGRPLFSPTRRPPDTAPPEKAGGQELPDLRLTGIVIEPDRRFAIFALAGAKPLVRSEGEALKDWRLDAISAEQVSISGPSGTLTLEPKPDANLVRPPPPILASPGQAQPGALPVPVPGTQTPGQSQRGAPSAAGVAPPAPAAPQIRPPVPPASGLNPVPPRLAHDDPTPIPPAATTPMPPALPPGEAPVSGLRHPAHDQ